MGLLARSAAGFVTVREASKTDGLLRGATWLIAAFPLYSAAGYIFGVHYSRYLDRRRKRLARASSCSARLTVSIGLEEAQKDEWQLELIQALARALEVSVTRIAFQGAGEARGEVFVRMVLTRPDDADKTGLPCNELWKRLNLKQEAAGPLASVTSVVVSGEKGSDDISDTKTYSLWLVPEKKAKEACSEAIKDLSKKLEAPSFEAHVTLLGALSGSEEDVKGFVEGFARETSPIPLAFKRLAFGSVYFRSVFLEAEQTEGLMSAHNKVRSLIPKSYLPEILGGRKCHWLDSQTKLEGFAPHLSLAYTENIANSTAEIQKTHESLVEAAAFTATEVEIWETDPEDRTTKSWKQIASFKLEGKQPVSFWKLFRRFARVAAPEIVQIAAGTGLSMAGSLIVEKACQHDSDLISGKHLGKSNEELVKVLMKGLVLWGATNQLFSWANVVISDAGRKIGARLKEQLFECLMKQDVKWITKKGANDLYKTLTQRTENIQRMFTSEVPGVVRMCTDFTMNIGVLWLTRPKLCAFGFGMFAFQNMTCPFFDGIHQIVADHDPKEKEVKENAQEVLQNFRTVRAFNREGREKQAFSKFLSQGARLLPSHFVEKLTDLGTWFSYEFTFQVAYLYGGMLVNMGDVKAEEVKDVVQKAFKSTWPLYQLRRRLLNKSTFAEDADAVLEALERPPEIPFEDETNYNPRAVDIRGEIEATALRFSYSDDTDSASLKDLNFKIPAGSMVGLVGPSGCGKSTLFNLLLRFYDPQGGAIKIDGVDLALWNPQALYRAVAWVSQEHSVFGGSVLDNIRYGAPDASEEEVLAVMKEAALYDDVMKKEKGVHTMASELSGGQKQRLSIARALLLDPKILLLDEATSALDTVSERKVQKAFEKLMKGRTVIAIAHRLSTIMNSDLILVLEAGQLIEQGSHAELLKKSGGKYADLVQQQLAVGDDNSKAETPTDPKAVQDCALALEELRARVPEEEREVVAKAVEALKNATQTLRDEKTRLAIKERSLLGARPWRTARSLRTAMRAVRNMRPSAPTLVGAVSAEAAAEEAGLPLITLERALSAASRLEEAQEEDETPAPMPLELL
eukprot:TRINITY_DN2647_c0_g1_i2.p1 TRINITY_DN2647_c0_g1~~TRINITY_DN2647_c0_g1_i2.p1  ORF type:complete len:1100 (+),score=216.01 TRINITY_DN2647_c0_g1_i2:53-3301(+)